MKINILIADDGYLNRLLIKKFIEDPDVLIYEAENGEEAIDIIKSNNIDIVLMDIQMPIMNGDEATRIIREEMPSPMCEIPIIAITAYCRDCFEDYGFNEIIRKPVSRYQIQNILNQYCKSLQIIT